jgi:hypothetical protein
MIATLVDAQLAFPEGTQPVSLMNSTSSLAGPCIKAAGSPDFSF